MLKIKVEHTFSTSETDSFLTDQGGFALSHEEVAAIVNTAVKHLRKSSQEIEEYSEKMWNIRRDFYRRQASGATAKRSKAK